MKDKSSSGLGWALLKIRLGLRDLFFSLDYERSFWGLLARLIVPFIAGVLVSHILSEGQNTFVSFAAGAAPPSSNIEKLLYLIAVLLMLAALGIFILIYVYHQLLVNARLSRRFSVTIDRDHHRSGKTHRMAFNRCLGEALNAKRNITVLSPHFPQSHFDAQSTAGDAPAKADSVGHDDYLSLGMEEVIERHAIDKQADFSYRRLVQVDSATDFTETQGKLDRTQLGNTAMAEHVAKMIAKNSESHTANIRAYVRSFVPSFPSTLVIDDKYMYFSLPTYLSSNERDGAKSLEFDLVIGIEDREGEIPRLFRQVITQFEIEAQEIKEVQGAGDAPPPPSV